MRIEQGLPALEGGEFGELGDLIVPLATNPAFVSQLFMQEQSDPSHIKQPDKEGHMPDTQHNLNLQRDIVRRETDGTNIRNGLTVSWPRLSGTS